MSHIMVDYFMDSYRDMSFDSDPPFKIQFEDYFFIFTLKF